MKIGVVTFGDRAILYHLYDAVPNLRPVFDSGQCPAINRSPAPDIIGPHPVHIAHEAGDRVSRGKGITMRKNDRSEEHTSELQSLMRISYAVFCLKKKKNKTNKKHNT